MFRIQLVDDDIHVLQALQRLLRRSDWQLDVFDKITDALAALGRTQYAVILADYRMPKLDGVSYLEWARQKQPAATRLMLSAYPESNAMLQAINRAEVFRFITKPWGNQALLEAVEQAIIRHQNGQNRDSGDASVHRLLIEQELAQLELIEPGITKIHFDADGAIQLQLDDYSDSQR